MKFLLDFGREVDIPTAEEIAQVMARRDAAVRAEYAGKKYWRMPPLTGYVASTGALDIGGDVNLAQASGVQSWSGKPVGPALGYVWEFHRLAVSGLTASGTAPDVVNLIRHGSGQAVGSGKVWQFNGNNWAYTFGDAQIVVRGGESLRLVNVGTFAATGLITLSGEGFEYTEQRFASQAR